MKVCTSVKQQQIQQKKDFETIITSFLKSFNWITDELLEYMNILYSYTKKIIIHDIKVFVNTKLDEIIIKLNNENNRFLTTNWAIPKGTEAKIGIKTLNSGSVNFFFIK